MLNIGFNQIQKAAEKPDYFHTTTARKLWDNPHIARNMLNVHLDPETDSASFKPDRRKAIIDWITTGYLAEKGSTFLDLGCGPGLYTTEIASRGIETTGIDFSSSSLQYARNGAAAKRLPINYIEGNYITTEISGQFDLITLIWCDICVLSPSDLEILFGKIKELLKRGGVFLFDFHSEMEWKNYRESSSWECHENDSFFSKGKHVVLKRSFKYDLPRAHCEKISIFRENQSLEELNLWINYYSFSKMNEMLKNCGLTVLETFKGDQSPLTAEREALAIAAGKEAE